MWPVLSKCVPRETSSLFLSLYQRTHFFFERKVFHVSARSFSICFLWPALRCALSISLRLRLQLSSIYFQFSLVFQVRLCGPWPDLEAHIERYRNSSADEPSWAKLCQVEKIRIYFIICFLSTNF